MLFGISDKVNGSWVVKTIWILFVLVLFNIIGITEVTAFTNFFFQSGWNPISGSSKINSLEMLSLLLWIIENNFIKFLSPSEILLVVDSMTGQDAVNVAESFNKDLDLSGVILTKLDGDTRGGAALSIKSIIDKPIKYAGIGEKMNDFD